MPDYIEVPHDHRAHHVVIAANQDVHLRFIPESTVYPFYARTVVLVDRAGSGVISGASCLMANAGYVAMPFDSGHAPPVSGPFMVILESWLSVVDFHARGSLRAIPAVFDIYV